jgi:hypothetical protein
MAISVDDAVSDGLTNYVNLAEDHSAVQEGAQAYRAVAETIRQNVAPGEGCSLAFPSMIIRLDVRTQCFVVVTDSKVVVAWKKGLFKKAGQSEVILRSELIGTDVESTPAGITVLKISGAGKTVSVALPKGRSDLGKAIGKAIMAL